jgi:tetratricopeptide (TPR) repeat protein
LVLAPGNGAWSAEVDSTADAPTNQTAALPGTIPLPSTNRDAIQQAIEQLRQEAERIAEPPVESSIATNNIVARERTEALEERLSVVERALRLQHRSELEAVHSSNRTVLFVAIILAGVVLAGIFAAVLVLTRSINRLTEVTTRLSVGGGWGHSQGLTALGPGAVAPGTFGQVEQVNARFLGAMERLEQRIHEMEQTAEQRPLGGGESGTPDSPSQASGKALGEPLDTVPLQTGGVRDQSYTPDLVSGAAAPVGETASRVSVLIGKGQALLNLGQTEAALGCFNEAIALDSKNAEALLKRGIALEKLHRMEEALDSYNHAIAADGSMTQAYLYKGSICNRLQRFREALECYEKAIRVEPQARDFLS